MSFGIALLIGSSAYVVPSAMPNAWHDGRISYKLKRSTPLATRSSLVIAALPHSEVMGDMPPAVSLTAPCKINLFLRILGKRDDGFHELASLFQTVSLSDQLDFWEMPPDPSAPLCSMEVSQDSYGRDGIPTDESNLVMKALKLYADRTGETRRIHCRLHKGVPAEAGLGGGSGDCATALFAANRLAGFKASEQELIEWSAELGSDISFFFSRGSAYCTGRGEIIEPVPPLPKTSLYLIKPPYGCSTPAIFKELGLQPGDKFAGPEPREMLAQFQSSVFGAQYLNDLEPPAFAVAPELKNLRDELVSLGFDHVMMSGSGSTIFAVGKPSSGKAGKWQADLKSKHGVEIFEESFCDRPEDDRLWYGEQAQSAGRSDSDGNRKGAALAALDTLPPDGFEWGGSF
jgi:4-diphosphocytidyl-2-C-methyl-D-erythritol kinase